MNKNKLKKIYIQNKELRLNLEPYLKKNKNLSEFERQLLDNDDNYMLNQIRPISSNNISKIPSKYLPNFIDDLNQKVNSVLYSSIANKLNKKSLKKKLLIQKSLNISKNNKSFQEPTTNSLYLKREKAVMLEKIKKNIDEYKFEKNKQYKILKEKNRVFRKQLKNSFNKQMEKFYEPMNEQRINDFSRILNKCMSERIIRKDNFNIPKVKLNIRNVYSRLYHNAVFLRDRMQNNKKLNLMNSNLSNSFNESDTFNSDMKREKNFKIKNIIKNSNGKEFTTKITPEIKRKCFLNYSGGPIKNNLYNINVNNKEFDNKKYLITLNKLIDENGNNNLQIAVKRHLIEFVQYFIDKKLDINYQNNFGDTALHIAMVEENLGIIQLLLNNNADLLIKNNERKTPFDLASGEIRKVFNLESLILEKKRK